ncbi:DUF3597 domain-containing protein [Erythrobacter insulae]|uniref:DUF3597 domain-containing protein n=1 Tax=Erythrobacter insulae TaxID=2584124 RepID=A0A547P919_9SPHN|nr:DUF3597 domain-containing protein [Erythrobacter insulae]TRD10642.1 DUF3597 domain-containing protein [Erythrobacter insulae]
MGIFSSIKSAIFGSDEEETTAAAAAAPAATAPKERAAISGVDVEQRIGSIPGADKLNWRSSIVDLMKLVQIDPSYANRKELAVEMGNTDYSGTAEDNIALHKAVMQKIADAGGIVPDDLKN